jgi:hypothetical protein
MNKSLAMPRNIFKNKKISWQSGITVGKPEKNLGNYNCQSYMAYKYINNYKAFLEPSQRSSQSKKCSIQY